MQFDIYRPKNAAGKVPAIFVRTPYNMNFWDVALGAPADMTAAARRGEARLRVGRRERARPLLLRRQLRHPRPAAHRRRRRDQMDLVAAVVERQGRTDRLLVDRRVADGRRGAGAEGARARSSRRASAPASAAWGRTTSRATGIAAARCRCCSSTGSYGEQNQVRPMFPKNTTQEDLIRASKSFDLAQHAPPVDWAKELLAPAGEGHHQGGRRPARHLRRLDARHRDRRRDDPAHAERSGVVQAAACSTTT